MNTSGQILDLVISYPIASYLLVITVVTFCQFGWDKLKARRNRWRTPEATLLSLCLIGGSIGGGAAIWIFRHKCSKVSFMRAFYGIVALQVIALAVFVWLTLNQQDNMSPNLNGPEAIQIELLQ